MLYRTALDEYVRVIMSDAVSRPRHSIQPVLETTDARLCGTILYYTILYCTVL
jgi:hypothetical protein